MEDRKKERRACRRELLWYSRIAGRHGTGNTAVCKRPASSFPSFLVSRSFSSRYKENGSSRNDLAVRCFLSRLNATLFSLSLYIYISILFLCAFSSFISLSFFLTSASNSTRRHAVGIEVPIVSHRYKFIGNIWISSRFPQRSPDNRSCAPSSLAAFDWLFLF